MDAGADGGRPTGAKGGRETWLSVHNRTKSLSSVSPG